MTEVLTKKNYDKVLPLLKYLDKNGKITPQVAKMVIKKSKSITYRYLTMFAETGYIEVSGNTNNAVYQLSKGYCSDLVQSKADICRFYAEII